MKIEERVKINSEKEERDGLRRKEG